MNVRSENLVEEEDEKYQEMNILVYAQLMKRLFRKFCVQILNQKKDEKKIVYLRRLIGRQDSLFIALD